MQALPCSYGTHDAALTQKVVSSLQIYKDNSYFCIQGYQTSLILDSLDLLLTETAASNTACNFLAELGSMNGITEVHTLL